MRLWHYLLLSVLPDRLLIVQWRECLYIARSWAKDNVDNRLVTYILKYGKEYFLAYCLNVVEELARRGIPYKEGKVEEIRKFCGYCEPATENYPEHNARYLQQCYYNLQEKFDRGMLTKEEFNNIEYTVIAKVGLKG